MSIQDHNKSEVKLSVLTSVKWLMVFVFCVGSTLLLFSKYTFSFHIDAKENSLLAALFAVGAIISFIRLLGSVIKTCWMMSWPRAAQDYKFKTERMVSAFLLVFVGLVFIYLAIKEILTGRILFNLSRHTATITTSATDFWFSVVFLILAGLFFCAIPAYGYYKLRKSALNNDSA